MATNFRREIARNRRHAVLLGTRIAQLMKHRKADGCVNSARMTLNINVKGQVKVKVTRDKKHVVHSGHPRGVDGMERARCR